MEKTKKYTQADYAEIFGTDQGTMSRILSDKIKLSYTYCRIMKKHLEKDIDFYRDLPGQDLRIELNRVLDKINSGHTQESSLGMSSK